MADDVRASWAVDVPTHRTIKGRAWRSSDPRIPAALRQRLVDELMAARRAVGAATEAAEERAARDRVHDAKVALGERGVAWWLATLDDAEVADRIRRTAATLQRCGVAADELHAAVSDVTSVSVTTIAVVLGR